MAKKILALCAALVAFAALPAFASAENSPELLENGNTVGVGSGIHAVNTETTRMTSSSGETLVACESATMAGTLTKNDGSNIEGNITSASFNTGGGECEGSIGGTTVTPNTATNGLPWCIRSTTAMATDEFQVRGNECGKLARPIRFALDVTFLGGTITCVYQRTAAISGTYTTGGEQAVLSITKSEFPLFEGGFGCPSAGYLDLSFKLQTANGTKLTIA